MNEKSVQCENSVAFKKDSLIFLRRKIENREVTKGKRLILIVYTVALVPNFRHLYEYMGYHSGFDLIDF